MKRQIEANLVAWKRKSRRKPLLVRGARQVGKTYSIKAFGDKHFGHLALFDLEGQRNLHKIFSGDLEPKGLLAQLEAQCGKRIIPGQTLLFLDEIQACPRALMALRYFHEQMPDLHVIAAGSLLEFAVEGISFPVGRVEFMWMYPLSFTEFLLAMGNEILDRQRPGLDSTEPLPQATHLRLNDLLRQYFIIGGMPEAVRVYMEAQSLVEVTGIHRALTEAYVQDFAKYGGRVDRDCITHVFERLPSWVGQQIKYTRLYPEKRVEQIKRALGVLERALLASRVIATSAQGLPLGSAGSDKALKYVWADIGLMRHLCGLGAKDILADKDLMDTFRGSLAEQFIGQQILAERGGSENDRLYYWLRAKRNSSAEIDYLMVRDGRIFPVEVKSGPAGRLQSLRLFLAEHPHCPAGLVFHSGTVQDMPDLKMKFLPLYTRLQEPGDKYESHTDQGDRGA